ncbi:hypothetical protein AB0B25_15410 [Nocardia sp. NPDC049190]|uniref:hypothetical protein n=1 Tax=Nocardia sp. NPDC049190 TaxID=3155650 RepID=UPI0033FE5FE7
MVQPTPWQLTATSRPPLIKNAGRPESASPLRRIDIRVFRAAGRDDWGYLAAAVGSAITFVLLFQPWLAATGPDGKISTNAFGRVTITTTMAGLWSGSPPPSAKVDGLWGILAGVAVFITVATVVLNLRVRVETLSRLTAGSTVAVSVFVVVALIYFNGKGSDLRAMVGAGSPRDMGTQIGLLIRTAAGNGQYPVPGLRSMSYSSPSLTTSGVIAGTTSLASAVAAVAQLLYGRRTGPGGSRTPDMFRRWAIPPAARSGTD